MRSAARQRVLELHRRRVAAQWVRAVRAAQRAGVEMYELDGKFGPGTGGFVVATAFDSLSQAVTKRVCETEPCREELANVFTFNGTAIEVQAHNREVRRRSALGSRVPRLPINSVKVPELGAARARERGSSCSTRARGSRRNLARSYSRGGDSGDDSGGGEPEPASGHLDGLTIPGAGR